MNSSLGKSIFLCSLITLILASCIQSETRSVTHNEVLKFQDYRKPKPILFEGDVKLNDFNLNDSFELELFIEKVGEPDRIERGGAEIIQEFGVDDFDLYYGKSVVNAGHGRVLYVKVADNNLHLNAINTDHTISDFYRCFGVHLENRDTNILINSNDASLQVVKDDAFNFEYIEYFGAPL